MLQPNFDPEPTEVRIHRSKYISPCRARNCPKRATLVAEKVDGAGRHCRQIEQCPSGPVGKIPHDFRRTAARNLIRANVPTQVAKLLTGHKTDSVFERYSIVDDKMKRAAVEQLAVILQKDGTKRPARKVKRLLTGKVLGQSEPSQRGTVEKSA